MDAWSGSPGQETRVTTLELAQLFSRPGDRLDVYAARHTEVLRQPFNLLGQATIAPGRYDFDRQGLELRTPGFRVLGLNVNYERGDFFDGKRADAGATLIYRPGRHFRGSLSYQINNVDLPGASFITRIAALRTDVAFNVEWSCINFIQYDNVSDRLGVNSRIRWIPRQGQELFLVLNYDFLDQSQGSRDFQSHLRDTTIKFSYTFRY